MSIEIERKFEIDEFLGDNAGLAVAEPGLSAADAPIPHPPWLGREVNHMPRCFNANLMAHAGRDWRDWRAAVRAGGGS